MKTLSLKQPWAYAIIELGKDIENRTWHTNYRGPFLIHASKNWDKDGELWLQDRGFQIPPHVRRLAGGIVGIASLVDCVRWSNSMWFFGPYGFVLKDIKPLPFLSCPGMLGFFNAPPEILNSLSAEITQPIKKQLDLL